MTEELEGVKAAMDEKGTSMTDAGPLVRIKQSLTRLKAESTQMEVRIGVVRGRDGRKEDRRGSPFSVQVALSSILFERDIQTCPFMVCD